MNPIWNMGFASSRWPKWPGHSAMLAVQVSHFIFLSIVPSRGSLNPPIFGLPLSVVSPCSICTTDICLCKPIQATISSSTTLHLQVHRSIKTSDFPSERFQFPAAKQTEKSRNNRKNYNFVRAEYSELNQADFGDLRRRERKPHIHGGVVDSEGNLRSRVWEWKKSWN